MTDAPEAVLSDADQAVIASYGLQLFHDTAGQVALRYGLLRAAALVIADTAMGAEDPEPEITIMVEDLGDDVRQIVAAHLPDLSIN